jgi:hypothetical protein
MSLSLVSLQKRPERNRPADPYVRDYHIRIS